MARKRMVAPTIWQDPDFGMMEPDEQIMFIGIISNADDEGRLRAHSAYLKSIIFVYKDYRIDKVEKIRNGVVAKMKNVVLYTVNSEEYISLKNWDKYQKQRDDRVVPSEFPKPENGVIADITPTDDGQLPAEVKLSKVKLEEVKLGEVSTVCGEFKNVSLSSIQYEKLIENIGEKNTHILIEELSAYMASKGKRYSSHYATLLNWARRKFSDHKEKLLSKGKGISA